MGGGKDIALIKMAHRATRATCRNLLADRESLQVLMSRPEQQAEDFQKFIRYLNDLRGQFFTRMTTTVEDEAANRSLLHDLTERERLMEETRDALQTKLNEVREEKENVTFGLDQTLRKLQLELQEITMQNNAELEAVQREMSDGVSKASTDHELRMRQLQDQVDGLERQCTEILERNREEEQRLRKDKARLESTLNAKIAQYDEDMASRGTSLAELKRDFERESKEYALLKAHFDRVDADLKLEAEEQQILGAMARWQEYGRMIVHIAARNIQRIVRGRQGRAIVNKMKPKGKGGKKGKK